MSLAYLEVLRRQTPSPDVDAPGLARELTALAAKEHMHLADLALANDRAAEALHWASSEPAVAIRVRVPSTTCGGERLVGGACRRGSQRRRRPR